MPKQSTDIYSPFSPALSYSTNGQTWKITKEADIGAGGTPAVWSSLNNNTLINKGYLYSYESSAAYFEGNKIDVANHETGHINGGLYGIRIQTAGTEASVTNDGKIFGGEYGVYSQGPGDFKADNTGEIYGYTAGIYVAATVAGSTAGPVIKNKGVIKSDTNGVYVSVSAGLRSMIVNAKDGVIDAGKAGTAAVFNLVGQMTLENKGKLKGDIASPSAAKDTIINTGKVTGQSYLGDGDDTFNNKDGKAGKLHGMQGDDKFILGSAKDKIVFDTALSAATNVDRVKNFESGEDKFFLSQAFFNVTGPGPLLGGEFHKGGSADDGNDRIIYKKGTGELFYDPDGAGGTGKTLFAELDSDTKLKASDFEVFA